VSTATTAHTPVRDIGDLIPRRGSLLLLFAAVALSLLPLFQHLPAWVPGLALAVLGWRALAALRGWALPRLWLRVPAALGAGALVMSQFGTIAGLEAGVALLVLLIGLKQLEVAAQRDAYLAAFLVYLVLATVFLFEQAPLDLLYGALVAVLVTAVLLDLSDPTEAETPLRRATHAGTLLLLAVPAMLVMFVLFPRLAGPIWGTSQPQSSATTGLSDEMSPGAVSDLARSNAVAFRVRFEGEPPPPEQRYWRGPVLSFYGGRTWSYTRNRAAPQPILPAAGAGSTYRYEITLEPHRFRWLMAMDLPTRIPQGAELTDQYTLVADRPIDRLRQYALESVTEYRAGLTLDPAERRRYTQLPPASAPRARALVQDWARADAGPQALVERALAHFRSEPFFYTLRPPLLSGDPVDEFLFSSRRGFCEHYASSFVVMMRAAGVPARVVTGYLGGEWNAIAEYLLVRQAEAHAWAEVWLQGRGWVRVDPTAAVAPERIELGLEAALQSEAGDGAGAGGLASWTGRFRLRMGIWRDTLDFYWNQWVVSFGPERQRALLERLGLGGLSWTAVALVMIGSVAALGALFATLSLLAGRRAGGGIVERLYARYCERLRRIGLERAPWEGPRAYAARVRRTRPELARASGEITRLYVDLRYRVDARGELDELRRQVHAFRPARKKKPAEAG
jgi:transglutaminase-like putative cysteine protease